jgi:hypothetical protein
VKTPCLGDIAHARAGDKGDTSILMIAPYDRADYGTLCARLSPTRIAAQFGTVEGRVSVRPSPGLSALTIVLRAQLNGGVTRATTIDPHGKSLSGCLLDMPLFDEAGAS